MKIKANICVVARIPGGIRVLPQGVAVIGALVGMLSVCCMLVLFKSHINITIGALQEAAQAVAHRTTTQNHVYVSPNNDEDCLTL